MPAHWAEDRDYTLGAFRKGTGALVGSYCLTLLSRGVWELGYRAVKEPRGHGFSVEAARALCDWAGPRSTCTASSGGPWPGTPARVPWPRNSASRRGERDGIGEDPAAAAPAHRPPARHTPGDSRLHGPAG
ncbi:GNAT family protein [Streptomyces sp. NPDC021356]|uniref:GNAT family N-acetyltransferase n=1 Tax=Streptomyces sp. NPDC021356 TaxID=3154900 RepID=UPI0033ECDE59